MSKTGLRLIQFYIFTIFTFGFWVNFFHFTLIIDLAIVLLVVYSIIVNKGRFEYNSYTSDIVKLSIIFSIGVIFIALIKCFTPRMSILGARSYIAYMIAALAIANIHLTYEQYKTVLNTLELFGVVSAAFGLVQSFFNAFLPDELLHISSGGISYVYGLGDLVFRSNGLYENTIVFGGVMGVVAIFVTSRLINEKNKLQIIPLIIIVASLLLTYSRAALVGFGIIIIFEELFNRNRSVGLRISIIIGLILLAFLIMNLFLSDSVIYQNLIGYSSSARASNKIHVSRFSESADLLKDNWLFGVGMGTQGYESSGSTVNVIRDGTWFTFMLEMGIPLTIIYVIILLLILGKAIKRISNFYITDKQRSVVVTAAAVTLYFVLNSFLNSAYNARENMALSWFFVALAFHDRIKFFDEKRELFQLNNYAIKKANKNIKS